MKHLAMLAAVALAGVMEEATDGTTGSAGGAVEEKKPEGPAQDAATVPAAGADESPAASSAPDLADTSGDTPGQPAGPHLDAPAASGESKPTEALVIVPGTTVALVRKGADAIPVQLKDQAHLEALRKEHGEANVEVQS